VWKYHPKYVEQFPAINKLCNFASCWIYEYIGILLGAHPILRVSRIRVKRGILHSKYAVDNVLVTWRRVRATKGGHTLVTLPSIVTPYRDSVNGTRDRVKNQKLVTR
jgi:hypothetical protein